MKCLYSVLFCFLISSVWGQNNYSLSGFVADENGYAIAIGDVLLYDANQENLIKYTQLIDGDFHLDDLEKNNYHLRISALGYQSFEKAIPLNETGKLKITLKESVTKLEEVEIVAAKNPITNNNGNLKIDITNPVFSAIPDPLDALSMLPNVQIAANRESISIIGRGNPLIYLGGQRIDFEEFRALSVDAIDSIELISNPSAKYEAEGRAVLLITRKKNVKEGMRMSVGETASFRQNFNNYLVSNGSYSNGKWTVQGNFAYNDLGQWESHTFAFRIPEEDIFSDYLVLVPHNKREELNGGLGLFYPLKNDDYISINSTYKLQTNNAPIETETFIQSEGVEDNVLTDTENDNRKEYFSGNFNYNKSIAKDLNLFSGFQYSSFKQTLESEISNNLNEDGFGLDETRDQFYKINSLAFRLDLEYTILNDLKWEFGTNWNQASADAFTEIQETLIPEKSIIDFDYKERLYSGYSTFSGNFKKHINYNFGLRVEYNQVKGEVENEASPLAERENTNFFPKVGLNIELDSTKTLSLNYAKSISRPKFSRTSSVRTFINPFLEAENNVNLLPTLTNELTANYQWKNKSINASFYRKTNPVNYIIRFDEVANRAIFSPVNLDKESGFNIGLTLPFSYKKWTSTNTVSLNYNKIEDDTADVGTTNPYLYAYSNQQFKIGKDTTVAFGGWLLTRRQEGIFKRNNMLVLNATITKTLFEKLQCAIRLNDITQAMNFEESYAINGVEAEGVYFVDAQEVAFSVKYNFGNTKKSKFKNKDVDENLNRIN
ncbi:outer membrane beta-barrel family protein [Flagellimonas eckloniae]|uniref:outer membrane beta-barrel family protein n=1 Tax=Flagellimonas eckloniae TaxID=346185 RepID=UPI00111245A3|nr:outer membrane beta-barrel family protein [Allomuricauda eckloniae]